LLADADNDGVNESEVLGCDLGGIDDASGTTTPVDNGSLDDDADGVINADDTCPNTDAGLSVNFEGCSTEQRLAKSTPSASDETNLGSKLMLMLMLAGVILAFGAFKILRSIEREAEETKDLITLNEAQHDALAAEPVSTDGWQTPVLDGSGSADDATAIEVTKADLARVPGWDEAMVRTYLDQGWSMDQLQVYYQEQVNAHAETSQD
jgi:hypothetical protein